MTDLTMTTESAVLSSLTILFQMAAISAVLIALWKIVDTLITDWKEAGITYDDPDDMMVFEFDNDMSKTYIDHDLVRGYDGKNVVVYIQQDEQENEVFDQEAA